MIKPPSQISQLFSIRNRYDKKHSTQKLNLLAAISKKKINSKKELQLYYDVLLFLIAYPDSRAVYELASQALQQLELYIQQNENITDILYNSGITKTQVCAAFSFDIVKWLRKKHPNDIR